MSSYHFETKNNTYTVENIGFIIGAIKITCTATVYLGNTGNQWPSKINSAVGFGFNCTEALMKMLDSIPEILSEHEKTNSSVVDESFDEPNVEERQG